MDDFRELRITCAPQGGYVVWSSLPYDPSRDRGGIPVLQFAGSRGECLEFIDRALLRVEPKVAE